MFELNGYKYDFKRVDVESALEIQSLIGATGDEESKAQKRLCEIAVKHLQIYIKDKGKETIMESPSMEYCAELFENPFFALEIVANFGEVVRGFLERLPSFKKNLKAVSKK